MRRGEDAQLPSLVSLQYWRPGSAFIAFKAGLGSRSETLWKAIRQLLPKFFFNQLKSLTSAPSLGSAKPPRNILNLLVLFLSLGKPREVECYLWREASFDLALQTTLAVVL